MSVAALTLAAALAAAYTPTAPPPTPRGIATSITVVHQGQPLMAKVEQSPASPVLVRVTDTTPAAAADAPHTYRIDFIGLVTGEYDLRPLIQHTDGTAAATLEPIPVTIVSKLPERYGTDLFGAPERPGFIASHYRTILWTLGALWVAIPVVVIVRRWMLRRPPPPPPPAVPAPTLADQIRPLAQAAMARALSVEEQARLELLLYRFWRDRRDLGAQTPAQAVASLRSDADASPLILALEGWIHAREPHGGIPLDELLAPYAAHAAIDLAGAAP